MLAFDRDQAGSHRSMRVTALNSFVRRALVLNSASIDAESATHDRQECSRRCLSISAWTFCNDTQACSAERAGGSAAGARRLARGASGSPGPDGRERTRARRRRRRAPKAASTARSPATGSRSDRAPPPLRRARGRARPRLLELDRDDARALGAAGGGLRRAVQVAPVRPAGARRSEVRPARTRSSCSGGSSGRSSTSSASARFSFCGLSLGGAVGMWLGANAGDRVDRLVLAARRRTSGRRSAGSSGPRWCAQRAWSRSPTRRWAAGSRRRSTASARSARCFVATPPEGYAACCDALRDWDFRDELGSVSAPTLVLVGSEDPATPPDQAQLIADGISGARLDGDPRRRAPAERRAARGVRRRRARTSDRRGCRHREPATTRTSAG